MGEVVAIPGLYIDRSSALYRCFRILSYSTGLAQTQILVNLFDLLDNEGTLEKGCQTKKEGMDNILFGLAG